MSRVRDPSPAPNLVNLNLAVAGPGLLGLAMVILDARHAIGHHRAGESDQLLGLAVERPGRIRLGRELLVECVQLPIDEHLRLLMAVNGDTLPITRPKRKTDTPWAAQSQAMISAVDSACRSEVWSERWTTLIGPNRSIPAGSSPSVRLLGLGRW